VLQHVMPAISVGAAIGADPTRLTDSMSGNVVGVMAPSSSWHRAWGSYKLLGTMAARGTPVLGAGFSLLFVGSDATPPWDVRGVRERGVSVDMGPLPGPRSDLGP
jgi:hypothetical protein